MAGGNNNGMTEEKAAVAYNETSKALEKKKNYHNGMEAAFKLKYDDEYDFMKTEAEKPVGEEPPILDQKKIKKDPGKILTDDIGSFFKENNVIENKGYGDGISINDVFKAQGCAAMYMSIDKHVDEVLGNQ